MLTWICKAAAATVLALSLAACDESAELAFASDLGALIDGGGRPRLAEVTLAGGAVKLAAPDGYCFDRRSLRRSVRAGFAMLARCDTLGVRGFFGAHELAIMTVTTGPQPDGAKTPSLSALAASLDGARVLERRSRSGLQLVRFADGAEGLEGVSAVHWRGVFALNGHLVAVGLYAPEGSAALKGTGATLLRELTDRTRKASPKQVNSA